MMFLNVSTPCLPLATTRVRAAAGTVRGLEHARLGRNNQDGVALHVGEEAAVAAVADGCSSGAWSEVGARFGAAWLAAHLPRIARDAEPHEWAARTERGLLEALASLAAHLAPDPAALPAAIADFLLFSFVAAVVARGRAVVLGAGDGVYAIDGEPTVLDPGPANAPAYLAYALLPAARAVTAAPPHVATLFDGDARKVRSLAVCTDGALDLLTPPADGAPSRLAALAGDAKLLENPSLLPKRLAVLAERERLLHDDTTIALLVQREEGA